jgi:hypothetical protein
MKEQRVFTKLKDKKFSTPQYICDALPANASREGGGRGSVNVTWPIYTCVFDGAANAGRLQLTHAGFDLR